MPYKKKVSPGSAQFNKLIAEQKIHGQVQFRHDLLESQKGLITKANLIDFTVLKKLPGLDANTKLRMQELQKKARQSLNNGEPSHRIYPTKF